MPKFNHIDFDKPAIHLSDAQTMKNWKYGDRFKATFKGTDGSLGFKFGEEYSVILEGKTHIWLRTVDGKNRCEYSNTNNFLENWCKLRNEEQEIHEALSAIPIING